MTNVTNGYVFGGASSASQRYNYDGFDNVILQYQDTGASTAFTTTTYDSLNRAQDVFNVSTSQTTTPEYLGASATVITDHIKVGTSPTDGDTKSYAYAPDGERLALNDQVASPASNETDYYTYNEYGDVEALTCGSGCPTGVTAGAPTATYGYTAYGANDKLLDSGPDFATNPAPTFIFNSYRFRAGRLDPSTSNLDLGIGTYNPNMNGFISRGALAVAPSGQNTPMSLGELLLGLETIQQGFHTVFQDPNASLGDKVWAGGWAALAIVTDVGIVASGAGLLVKGAAWAVDAVRVARLAKGADEAITAASDAEKLVTAASDAEKLVAAADDGVGGVRGVCGVGAGLSFSADTLVATPTGERAIGSLKVGDQVTAYDPATGKSSTQTVQHVWLNHDHDLLDVTLHEDGTATQADAADAAPDKAQEVATKAHGSQAPPSPSDETIHTTEQHPWLTMDRGWVQAGDLHIGEHVVELGGHTATITAMHVRPGAATYYNLTVSTLHTYAVGSHQFVVHNDNCLGNNSPAQADTRQRIGRAKNAAHGGSAGVYTTDAEGSFLAEEANGAAVYSKYGPATMYGTKGGAGGCAEFRCGAYFAPLYDNGFPRGGEINVYLYHEAFAPPCPSCRNMLVRWAADNKAPINVFWLDAKDQLWTVTYPK